MDTDLRAALKSGLDEALVVCGHKQAELARRIGLSSQAVQQWCVNGWVPLKRVRLVSDATGVPDYRLRPDHYAPPHESTTRAAA